MSSLKFGPQTTEIEEIVAKLSDSANNAVWDATFAETWDVDAAVVALPSAEARADARAREVARTGAEARAAARAKQVDRATARAAAKKAVTTEERDATLDAALSAGWFAAMQAPRDATGDAAYYVATNVGWSVGAIAIRDLIGETFTQEHYDSLTESLTNFLAIVDETDQGSPERVVAIDLLPFVSGAEVVATAKKILG